jgi:hypothetical protein
MSNAAIDLEKIYETIADRIPDANPDSISINAATGSAGAYPTSAATNPQLTIIADAMKRAEKLFTTKNSEYGDKGDILANFRRLAEAQGVPLSTAWFFLAGKHIDSITQYVKDARENKMRKRTEPIRDRIDDMVVYSLLLLAIVAEENR